MNIAKVEELVQQVIKDFSPTTFIYDLLAAYGKPKASITRLQKGNLNLSKNAGEIVWKKNLLFRALESDHKPSKNEYASVVQEEMKHDYDLHVTIDQLRKSDQVTKHDLRFVVVTDYKTLLAVDTKSGDTLDIPLKELPKHFDFFLPWSGKEKHKIHTESQADIKAAYRMAKLYDEICKENPGMDEDARHSLNVFLSRILFCFFAEDTEIFPGKGMFTSSIASHTQEDGSDLDGYLDNLFDAMNKEDRSKYPAYIQGFPYVNGGLFANKIKSPKFSRQARKILVECGELNWSEINPDIFGSMMQAVVHPEQRSAIGMHYTSVPNIMKVIEPLFLNELRQQFEENFDNRNGLEKLRKRLSTIRVFDPACGSGNFLIISFKELRKLEIEIFLRLRELDPNYQTLFTMPEIQLTQFYGIEIDDFAHEIATLSLWLAEHQMNVKFKENLGILVPALPLKPSGHIVCGNSTRIDWDMVCPKNNKSEVYVLGNPPYVGYSLQEETQKLDMTVTLGEIPNYKALDYIACWFIKGAKYIAGSEAQLAFVTTNSLCQGEQVALLWPNIFERGLEISFAYKAFNWSNNAKHKAGVTCSIVGLQTATGLPKRLYLDKTVQIVSNINAYLAGARNVIVYKRSAPLSKIPPILRGSGPVDDGNLLLTNEEREKILQLYPEAGKFLKRVMGSKEFIHGLDRWCIWVEAQEYLEAKSIKALAERFEKVRQFRLKSKKEATKKLADVPFRFGEPRYIKNNFIVVPSTSSEQRQYLPFGFLDHNTIITNSAQAIYDPEPWVFAVISSRLHNTWVRAVGGRMRTDIRYSAVLCYNTFPLPSLSEKQKDVLSSHALIILSEREKHPEKTLAQLYDPKKMPAKLQEAHQDLDIAIEKCYRSRPFASDEDRLEYLFKLYEEMTTGIKGKAYA